MPDHPAPLPTTPDPALRAIEELQNEQFLIPAYQRGYRWPAALVRQLLDDVDAFKPGPTEAFYCLQPVVVRRVEVEGKWKWEVIDGQQRLTTIWLILRLLRDKHEAPPYSLDFATHARQQLSLATLEKAITHAEAATDADDANSSLEASYIFGAAAAVADWREKKLKDPAAFCRKLLMHTKVIWHDVSQDGDGPAEQVFARLNAGKILLTDAELIKALLLKRQDGAYKAWQFELAAAWDGMEAALNQPAFAGWLRLPDGYSRLGWLLQQVEQRRPKADDEPRALFVAVQQRLHTEPEQAWPYWQTVENVFQRLRAWYDDPGHYHRVGYLLAGSHASLKDLLLKDLLAQAERLSRPEFWEELNRLVAAAVGFDLAADRQAAWDELTYGEENDKLRQILLLHNVATAEQARGLSGRFPFAAYRAETWSLEHIHPQNPADESASVATYQQWLSDWRDALAAGPGAVPDADPLNDVDRADLTGRLDLAQQALSKTRKSSTGSPDAALDQELRQLRSDYLALFSDLSSDEEHGLGNLALLTRSHNSTLNNDLFADKRGAVLKLARTPGEVVVPATLQVFLKAYTPQPDRLNHWRQADSHHYRAAVEDDIRQFLTAKFSTTSFLV